MASGIAAIFFALKGNTEWACGFVLVGVLSDGLDGKAARWLGQESLFGRRFDSTADFVSFGLAPAIMFYLASTSITPFKTTVAALFVFCAAYRLARFHRLTKNQPVSRIATFLGLPTTASALFFTLAKLALPGPWFEHHSVWLMLVLAALMVSRIPFHRPRQFRLQNSVR